MREMHLRMIRSIRTLGLCSDLFVLDDVLIAVWSRRYLLRLWLRNEELAWKTPKTLEPIWKRLFSVGPDEQRFPLEPEKRRKETGRTNDI